MLSGMMLALFLSCVAPLRAQSPADVQVMLHLYPEGSSALGGEPAGDGTGSSLESVIRGAIDLALERHGFAIAEDAAAPNGQPSYEFELTAGYVLDMDRVILKFALSDARALMATEAGTFERILDPGFDQALGEYVETLLAPVERELALRPRLPRVPLVPQMPEVRPAAIETVPPESPESIPDEAQELVSSRRQPSGLRAGIGGFVPLGRAASYFGMALQYQTGWDVPLGRNARWSAGAAAAFMPFPLVGQELADAGNLFTMVSATTTLHLATIGYMSAYVAASAGPALAVMRGAGSAVYTKLMPFGTAGLGSELRIAGRFSLNLEVSSALFLDTATGSVASIWGLIPSLSLTMEL